VVNYIELCDKLDYRYVNTLTFFRTGPEIPILGTDKFVRITGIELENNEFS
jgi:hypothetical protein